MKLTKLTFCTVLANSASCSWYLLILLAICMALCLNVGLSSPLPADRTRDANNSTSRLFHAFAIVGKLA